VFQQFVWRAIEAAGALAVLTTPGLPLSTIFGNLEQDDK
jgi:hypothetical protein